MRVGDNELQTGKSVCNNTYFDKAIDILNEKYLGKVEVTRMSWQSDIDNLEDKINKFINEHSTYSMTELKEFNNKENGIIVLNEPIDTFEKVAKEQSEFKYIIFNDTLDKAATEFDTLDVTEVR